MSTVALSIRTSLGHISDLFFPWGEEGIETRCNHCLFLIYLDFLAANKACFIFEGGLQLLVGILTHDPSNNGQIFNHDKIVSKALTCLWNFGELGIFSKEICHF